MPVRGQPGLAPSRFWSNQAQRAFVRKPQRPSTFHEKRARCPEFPVRSSGKDRVCLSRKERRIKFREPKKLHRKSGVWEARVRWQVDSLRPAPWLPGVESQEEQLHLKEWVK